MMSSSLSIFIEVNAWHHIKDTRAQPFNNVHVGGYIIYIHTHAWLKIPYSQNYEAKHYRVWTIPVCWLYPATPTASCLAIAPNEHHALS